MDEVPSVTQQGVDATFIRHPHEPLVRNYNSGIIVKDGQRYLCTRRFDVKKWGSELIINRLDGDVATFVARLALPRAHGRESHEDARMIWFHGKILVAYTEGQYWMRPWVAIQKLAVLRDDWSVERIVTIGYGQNSLGQEKNWQFFVHDGRLHFVYSVAPHVVVELDEDFKVRGEWRHHPMLRKSLRGGTPPVRIFDRYISFPHFHVDHPSRSRRYGFVAYSFEAKPPFTVLEVSPTLVLGSENDTILPNLAYPHWTPLVVFPCGALRSDCGTWTVCAGINDSYDALFVLHHDRLKLNHVELQECSTSNNSPP